MRLVLYVLIFKSEFINNKIVFLRGQHNRFLSEIEEAFFALAFMLWSGVNLLLKK